MLIDTHSFFGPWSFDTDDRYAFGFIHYHSPLGSPASYREKGVRVRQETRNSQMKEKTLNSTENKSSLCANWSQLLGAEHRVRSRLSVRQLPDFVVRDRSEGPGFWSSWSLLFSPLPSSPFLASSFLSALSSLLRFADLSIRCQTQKRVRSDIEEHKPAMSGLLQQESSAKDTPAPAGWQRTRSPTCFPRVPWSKYIICNWWWNLLLTNGKNKRGDRPCTPPYLWRTWRTWNKKKDHLGHNSFGEEWYLSLVPDFSFFPSPSLLSEVFFPAGSFFAWKTEASKSITL